MAANGSDAVPAEIREAISNRQLQVLRLIANGLSAKEIARELGISHETVRKHSAALRARFDVPNAKALVAKCLGALDESPDFARLTQRERMVAVLLAQGGSAKSVARALGMSPGTAAKHRENILRKLQLRSVLQLTASMAGRKWEEIASSHG